MKPKHLMQQKQLIKPQHLSPTPSGNTNTYLKLPFAAFDMVILSVLYTSEQRYLGFKKKLLQGFFWELSLSGNMCWGKFKHLLRATAKVPDIHPLQAATSIENITSIIPGGFVSFNSLSRGIKDSILIFSFLAKNFRQEL